MENVICPRGANRYTWREGDTLQALALRNGVTEQAIRLANEGRSLDALQPGDEVCVPPRQLTCVSGELYVVKRGDTYASIARAAGISTLELSERNPYVDPNDLTVGQVLCLPEKKPAGGGSDGSSGSGGSGGSGSGGTPPLRPSPCPEGYTAGTVAYGQTFTDLLLKYNVSYQALRLSNPSLSPDRLLPGQRFCVPPTGTRGLCPAGAKSYILKSGENLQTVAASLGASQGRLLRLNPNLAPGDFVPGRVICVG